MINTINVTYERRLTKDGKTAGAWKAHAVLPFSNHAVIVTRNDRLQAVGEVAERVGDMLTDHVIIKTDASAL